MGIKLYWKNTRSPLYNFIFTLPLFLLYEIGIILTTSTQMVSMRNGADAIMRQLLSALGINGFYWIGGIFFVSYVFIYFVQRKYWNDIIIDIEYLIIMAIESLVWAVLLYFFMSNIHILLMNPNSSLLIQQVTLAIGAGIYEEFLFRLLLIAGLSKIIGFIFQWSISLNEWVAMILAAGIFSSFHFIGEFGDYFSFNIFMIRFFAGIILGILYFSRGFGITAWTHSIYDLIVLTKITTN